LKLGEKKKKKEKKEKKEESVETSKGIVQVHTR